MRVSHAQCVRVDMSVYMMTSNHAHLFVAVAALARHAARCLPSNTSLINLTVVQYVQVIL